MSQITCIKDISTPPGAYLSAQYKKSFAYHTLQERAPVILTTFLDQLVRDKCEISKQYKDSQEELKQVIGNLSKLKNELQTNKPLQALASTGSDESTWNKFLESFEQPQDFYTTVFLYAECYIYRRIQEAFDLTCSLREYDIFQKKKDNSLVEANYPIVVVSKYINDIKNKTSQSGVELENDFLKLLRLSVWGNRCDLSITAGADNSQTTDPLASLTNLGDKVIVDDSIKIWTYLNCVRKTNANTNNSIIIDIILDNAGYEFFTDLCFADFLIHKKFATKIRFYVKAIPWYISDVTTKDFHHVINSLYSDCDSNVNCLGKRLKSYLDTKQFEVIVDSFWTSPYEFSKMQDINKSLYDMLSESKMALFKGDLNHRKLLADKNRPVDTEFKNALEGFLPTSVCTLRTIKCDVMCGIEQKKYEDLIKKYNGNSWMETGEYAVIQCALKQ